ncbi:MAG: c-type cytochrome [Gammaproteobacteria bacterium]
MSVYTKTGWLDRTAGLALSLGVCVATGLFATAAGADGDPAAGESMSATCAACHGNDGNSPDPQWPNLAGQHERYIAKQLAAFQEGEEGSRNNAIMLGIAAGLSKQDMADLGAFYATQAQRPGFAEGTAELIARGERLYRGGDSTTDTPACQACHGPDGLGDPLAGFPRLAGQHAVYVATQLMAFRAEERTNDPAGMMRASVDRLSDEDIEALAQYIAGLY